MTRKRCFELVFILIAIAWSNKTKVCIAASGSGEKAASSTNIPISTSASPSRRGLGIASPANSSDPLMTPQGVSDVLVYPVPWVPNDGLDDNGKPYVATDPSSGILFANLSRFQYVLIYTVDGRQIHTSALLASSTAQRRQWDARDSGGKDVPTGVYFAIIRDWSTGDSITRRIAIIR